MSEELYVNRPEWKDVRPIPQYDPNATPIAPIFYTEAYRDATDYFRGILKIGEKSQRVLELTESIIRMNPGHYSAWQYRYQTLLEINAPLSTELKLMDELAELHLKTYQVWHHRRLLLLQGALGDIPTAELDFIARGLNVDAKNYHTWAYRQWLLAHFNRDELWAGELDYIESKLDEDMRNNSAWHHRFFVVFGSGVRKGEEDRKEVARREFTFTKEKIAAAPNNASAWNYLRGVLDFSKIPYDTLKDFVLPYALARPTESGSDASVVDLENPRPSIGAELPCPAAIEFLADIYEKEDDEGVLKAIGLWTSLGEEHDTIRKKYWKYRIQEASAPQKK